jgi:hypothetical protein
MNPDNRENLVGVLITPVKEITRSSQESFDRLEQLTMRDFAAKLPPKPLNRVQPGTVGRQIE